MNAADLSVIAVISKNSHEEVPVALHAFKGVPLIDVRTFFNSDDEDVMTGAPDFDWLDEDSIAVREQSAIAVYQNRWGHLIIRREADPYEAEDAIVSVAPQNIEALVEAIMRTAGLEPAPQRLLPVPAAGPKDPSAAGRQRRSRRNKRDTDRGFHVNGRDTREPDLQEVTLAHAR